MTVNEMIEKLRELKAEGHGDSQVMMIHPIEGISYFTGETVVEPLTTVESCFSVIDGVRPPFVKLLF